MTISAVITACWCIWLSGEKGRNTFADVPNQRSMHSQIVARSAGAVFAPCFLLGCYSGISYGAISLNYFTYVIGAIFLVALVGFWDDLWPLTVKKRLVSQFVAAGFLIIWFVSNVQPLLQGVPLYMLVLFSALMFLLIMTSINFFNFADGINGYAGLSSLMAIAVVIGFAYFAVEQPIFSVVREWEHAFGCLAVSILVYLYFNMFRKSVFMGDSGSTTLGIVHGFLLLIILKGAFVEFSRLSDPVNALWKATFVAILLATGVVLFIFLDCGSILVAKLLCRFPLAGTHKEHIFQKLAARFSHKAVSVMLCLLQALAGAALFSLLGGRETRDILFYSALVIIMVSAPLIFWQVQNFAKLKKS